MIGLLRLSPYVRMLEERVKDLTSEREKLLNRLLHAYSGYELDQPVPSYLEAQQAQAGKVGVGGDEVLGTGIHSNINLMQELENATLQMAEGLPDITVSVARQKAQEENERAAKEYEKRLESAKLTAAAQSGVQEL